MKFTRFVRQKGKLSIQTHIEEARIPAAFSYLYPVSLNNHSWQFKQGSQVFASDPSSLTPALSSTDLISPGAS